VTPNPINREDAFRTKASKRLSCQTLGFMVSYLDKNTLAIVSAFQRLAKNADPSETDAIPLETLRRADAVLGSRDRSSPYRLALRQRISNLESREDRKRQSLLRVVSYIVTFALGVLTTAAAEFVMRR
jgi:hypothetical protein